MPPLIRKEKITSENCGTQSTRNNIVRHKKRFSVRTLYCTPCPNFSTKSQNDLKYHIAKKHCDPKLDVTSMCNFCYHMEVTLYVNIEKLNEECRSDQEQEMWMWMWNTFWETLRITG